MYLVSKVIGVFWYLSSYFEVPFSWLLSLLQACWVYTYDAFDWLIHFLDPIMEILKLIVSSFKLILGPLYLLLCRMGGMLLSSLIYTVKSSAYALSEVKRAFPFPNASKQQRETTMSFLQLCQ